MLTDLENLANTGAIVEGDRLALAGSAAHTRHHCNAGWDTQTAMPVLCTNSAYVGRVALANPARIEVLMTGLLCRALITTWFESCLPPTHVSLSR
jgi:hypothetical protein